MAKSKAHLLSQLDGLRVSYVDIARRHSQNNTIRILNVLPDQSGGLLLNVPGLVPDRVLSDPWQVHQGQCWQVSRVDPESDRLAVDVLVIPAHSLCIPDYFFADKVEVFEFLFRAVKEGAPGLDGFDVLVYLHDKWSSCHYPWETNC